MQQLNQTDVSKYQSLQIPNQSTVKPVLSKKVTFETKKKLCYKTGDLPKTGSNHKNKFLTEQEKGDLLIQVTA